MHDKPALLPVLPENIPLELRKLDRWVMWRLVKRVNQRGEVSWTKVPFTVTGENASSTDPQTWTQYEDVCDALIFGGFDGIGLVLGGEVHGIDVDDCRDPMTGELSPIAEEILQRVDGYCEVSPTGTGIKLFSTTNLDGSRTKKEVGLELYCESRYFTVTGHAINGHDRLPAVTQDVGWLTAKYWGQDLSPAARLTGSQAEIAFALYKPPLDGWDADRVQDEIAPFVDLECHYEDWIRIGAALFHQFDGSDEGFALWDEMFAESSKYSGSDYGWERWRSFKTQRATGRGPITLASVIEMVRPAREAAMKASRDQTLKNFLQTIALVTDVRDLQDQVGRAVAKNSTLSDVEREQIAVAIRDRAKELQVKLSIALIRQWLRPTTNLGFPHMSPDGYPLCTLENMRTLIARLGFVVRYNVIKKSIELLIPGAAFTRDNRSNASLAVILSECEKVRMSTKFVPQFLIKLADENQYNPVLTYIESVPWDGVSRLEDFYATVHSNALIKKKLMRKWLVQCVGAAVSPDGIANQGILTFIGPQNIGKTTWFQRLAPLELDVVLTGHTLDTKSKDSIFIALSHWIVELGEVDATMRKSDISALKSFITQTVDKLRRPYAATESEFSRRTTFGASVNDSQYLHDPTGSRRFWSLEADGFVLNHTVDMQQLWAEVLALYRAGERWYLDQNDVAELNDHNADYTVVDPIDERLGQGFDWAAQPVHWVWMTATQALQHCGIKDPTKANTIAASIALKKLNGAQRKKVNGRIVFAVPADFAEIAG
jgi:hypothetical protein